ncbi:MAG TPA: hypothetical protein VHY20_09520, partial [Pirellulales bacterium]|nr:hypothetical protein [Pirellulales bacterium]
AASAASGNGGQWARHVLVLFHTGDRPQEFALPEVVKQITWRLFVDTAAAPPADVYPQVDGPALPADGRLSLADHALVCYVSAE